MTFRSPEVRHSFHALSTSLQVMLHAFWTQVAKQNYFIEVTEVTGEEVTVRLTRKPKVSDAPLEVLD